MPTPRPPSDEIVSLFQAAIAHEGVTTAIGNAGGTSIKDAGLAGFGANRYQGFIVLIYPDDTTKVDAQVATAFDNVSEITVDTAFKGGQVPAGVKYKILTPSPTTSAIVADLGVPAADAVANALERDVIGNKTDTATPDDMSGLATSSLMRDLKRALLRLAPAAFTATIQGAARTDLAAMAATLATYFKAAGAAYSATIGGAAKADIEASFTGLAAYFNAASAALSVTIDNGGAARSNLNDILSDLGKILNGAGITTFPARALPANGVSLAAVERYTAEVKPEWAARTAATYTTTTATEETILTTAYTVPGLFYFNLTLRNMVVGDDFTIRVYKRVDGTNYDLKSAQTFVDAPNTKVYQIEGEYNDSIEFIRITIQRNSATNRAFPYSYNIVKQAVA